MSDQRWIFNVNINMDPNNINLTLHTTLARFIAQFGDSPADLPSLGASESEEEILGIQARAGGPRQNSQPSSPGLPESVYSSTESDNEVAEDLQCGICLSGREITVQFRGCSHASCTQCMKDFWWSKVQDDIYCPSWFLCPWCRAKILEVGMLSREGPEPTLGDVAVHGGVSFTVCTWEKLVEWMSLRSKRMIARTERVAEDRARFATDGITEEMLQGLSPEQHLRIFATMMGGINIWSFGRRVSAFELENLVPWQRFHIREIIAERVSGQGANGRI